MFYVYSRRMSTHSDATLLVHIATGVVGIVSGFAALYAAKGARLHRASGMVFVYTMLTMSILGAVMAAARNKEPASNVPVGVLTAYLVMTALTTVRPLPAGSRWLGTLATVAAAAVTVALLTFGFQGLLSADGQSHGVPAFPFLLFGTVGLAASAGDIRLMRSGDLRGAARLTRHLWRMCFALGLAAFSFVPRLAPMVPKPLRTLPVLVSPVLVVLVTMVYWLWRVRPSRTDRHVARAAPDWNENSPAPV